MLLHLPLLFICLIGYTYSQRNTINKACGTGDSTCDTGQVCIDYKCECDPSQRRFWAGEKLQCRVCPPHYLRQPNRCYKYYSIAKNQSAARADCRKDQADLFSWRDNSDETELITASTTDWITNHQLVLNQFYSWGGGIVHHGSTQDYKITWFDPKGPTIRHPDMNEPESDRFCNEMMIANYQGDPEPTRLTQNGETENCVSFVFLPRVNLRGQICMADDFCSTKMSYICELTEVTILAAAKAVSPTNPITNAPSQQIPYPTEPINIDYVNQIIITETPAALGGNDGLNMSNVLIYIVGLVVVLVIFGIVSFIIIRKRKQNAENLQTSPVNSMASSTMSDAETSQYP